ncbi:DarT ssDNA thymidine ADP-ribosyltransferase family protein [Veillonella agrestimuris]|uniref:DarT ssDNA thymidine ADP-ribosyltransferase family protein n=1 Tax=Veillonella agrestimuris TaxID=2941340 RepID=UPI002040B9D6|nr:DarT ssDNA thymidine ADP-ribosyltransferase family protein [Veillonella agrestimuris]
MCAISFCTYTDFDVAVVHNEPNKEFVYLGIYRNKAEENKFLIIPKHPLSISKLEIYNYNEGVEIIDWDAMEYGSIDYDSQVRMAECLSPHQDIEFDVINIIITPTEAIKQKVEKLLDGHYSDLRVCSNLTLFPIVK